MLDLAVAIRKEYLPRSVVRLEMVLWCSCKNAGEAQCSILDGVTIFDSTYNGISHGILVVSIRIPWNLDGNPWEWFPEAPGFRPFPSEFLGKKWEFPWNGNGKWLGLQPNISIEILCNSDFPLRIWWIPWELMGEGKDLA